MKIQALRAFQMLTLLLMLGVTSAHALTSDKVVANIPFDFTVGKTTLPAGEYVVQRGSRSVQKLDRIIPIDVVIGRSVFGLRFRLFALGADARGGHQHS